MESTDDGRYRGSVVDNADPEQQGRLLVVVPEIYGSDPVWALPSRQSGSSDVPAVGEDVWVVFERGDPAYPVWEHGTSDAGPHPTTTGYADVYRGVVVDGVDPSEQGRLHVTVPEVTGDAVMWATRGPSLDSDVEVPAAGSDVWIEFEYGDPQYPVWVGIR
jgi:hypothetical protein